MQKYIKFDFTGSNGGYASIAIFDSVNRHAGDDRHVHNPLQRHNSQQSGTGKCHGARIYPGGEATVRVNALHQRVMYGTRYDAKVPISKGRRASQHAAKASSAFKRIVIIEFSLYLLVGWNRSCTQLK